MLPQTPSAFSRAFSQAWLSRDLPHLLTLFAEDADVQTLTGAWCEDRKTLEQVLTAELTGAFARARLVTGRAKLRELLPSAVVIHQRFVLSGLMNADGSDAGRIGAILMAVLRQTPEGWQAVAAQFSAEAD